MRRFLPLALFGFAVISCLAQSATDAQRIDVSLERREGAAWKGVPPGFVFKNGDRLRFRVRANFDGFLYVMNYGTSGQYSNLFPREETGRQNQLQSGREYQVPATEASFRVEGPPGFDTVYWVMTPLKVDGSASHPAYVPLAPPPPNPLPQNLKPRCDDSILRARSQCIDSSAGPRNIAPDEPLPANLSGIARAKSRDLVILNQAEGTSISSPARLDGPFIYKFRVAHE
jgi:Domain of unknown function (DUF4384)